MFKRQLFAKSRVKLFLALVLLVLITSSLVFFKNEKVNVQESLEMSPAALNEASKEDVEYPLVISSIAELQEVKDFQKQLEEGNRSKFGIAITDYPDIGRSYFAVKVYESFNDHDTVFNWYRVSVEGEVRKQDIKEQDKWDVVQAKTLSLIPAPSPKTVVVEKEIPAQCPITNDKYAVDMKNKDDQIAQMQKTIVYLNNEVMRLSNEIFILRGRVNLGY